MTGSKIVRALYIVVSLVLVAIGLIVLSLIVSEVVAQVRVPDARGLEITLPYVLSYAMTLTVLVMLRRFVRPIVAGADPFTSASVRRIRQLAIVVLVGYPVVDVASRSIMDVGLREPHTLLRVIFGLPGTLATPVVIGLMLLVFAEVFAHGVRLRDDVEGTI